MMRAISLLILPLFVRAIFADEPLPKTADKFDINGHTAFLYAAPKPAKGKPWVWYAPTLRGVSLVQRKMYFEGFLRAGISVAGFDLGEVRGSPASTAQFTLFYDEMVKRGWSPKPILLGQSRGGLMMLAWAVRHPDKTHAFVGIYPVCNLENWPMKNKAVTLADYQLTEQELRAKFKELNPLDNLKGLLEHKVPMFVVHGDTDATVPYKENTQLLKERYEAGGGAITVKLIAGEGHKETPSFFECKELMEFVVNQATQEKSPGHGYLRKEGHIYFEGQRIDQAGRHDIKRFAEAVGHPLKLCQDVDAASFVALSEEYSRDKNKVYYKWISPGRFWVVELDKADPATFQVLDFNLAKDKTHVWKSDHVIQGADAASAQVVNLHWVWKDKNRVYYQGTVLAGAEPASFRHLAQGYYRDAKRVFWCTDPLPDADPESFRACGEELPYAYDRQHVWSGSQVLAGVDAKTFKHLDAHVFKDAQRVYVGTSATMVPQADPASFEKVAGSPEGKVALFRDRSRHYVYSPSYLELYSLERKGDSILISKPVWLARRGDRKEKHGATVSAQLKDGVLSNLAVTLEPAFKDEPSPEWEKEKLKGMKSAFVEAQKLMGK